MRASEDLKIGVTAGGTTHSDAAIPDVETKFRMVKEAGVFDYIDRSPPDEELADYERCVQKYALPVLSSGWFYTLGADEKLFERNIDVARRLGSQVHNVQVRTNGADGTPVSDQQVADFFLRANDYGLARGVAPCFEVHVNMWSEHFGRVAKVAALVAQRGVKFRMTLDHSHVIFKIDNPKEQEIQGMRADVEAGRVVLDPFKPGAVTTQWIDANWVRLAHARAAVPNGPINIWAKHPDGSYGRGIQYPFVEPKPGEWHSAWDQARLEPWKEVVRHLFRHHARDPNSPLSHVSCEFIPPPDYGGGAKYSIFEQNVACARWLRETWGAAVAS
jgi:hypothetical protein